MKNRNSKFTNRISRTLSLILYVIFLGSTHVYAQLTIVPTGAWAGEERPVDGVSKRTEAISLPFFDDFATTNTGHPNTDYWLPGSGVYINNNLATSQPSLNFATFDGLSASGKPYNQINTSLQNGTDTLVSQVINLSGLAAKDSVYFSFYWLAKGLGEMPDSLDNFVVEFKNNKNIWEQVWKIDWPIAQDSLFSQAFVRIDSAKFFHADFQFRIRTFGRLSGPYDTWHLDYIYLNKNRSIKDPYLIDVAARRPLTSLLKNYWAMPLKQYQVDPTGAKADTVVADVYNNHRSFNQLTRNFTIVNKKTKQSYFNSPKDQSPSRIGPLGAFKFKIPVELLNLQNERDEVTLESQFIVITSNTEDPDGVDLRRNDMIAASTTLSNYYAYDDGSAEAGVQINQKQARAAVRFVSPKADTIQGVKMYIVPFGGDVTGQSFNIQILCEKNGQPGKPDSLLATRAVTAKYPADRNGLVEFFFNPKDSSGIAVPKVFYIGWQQINEPYLAIGYDKNSQLGNGHIFFNLGNEWVQEKSLKGSIMIRPVMGGKGNDLVLGTEPIVRKQHNFFPNPAQNSIHWEGKSFKSVEIYSVQGTKVKTVLPAYGDRSISVEDLANGIYIFKATDGKQNYVQKMLIAK